MSVEEAIRPPYPTDWHNNLESKKHFCDCKCSFSNVELVRTMIIAPHMILCTLFFPILCGRSHLSEFLVSSYSQHPSSKVDLSTVSTNFYFISEVMHIWVH